MSTEAHYENEKALLVSFHNMISSNKPLADIVAIEEMAEGKHSLEKADNLIILHAVDIALNDPNANLHV